MTVKEIRKRYKEVNMLREYRGIMGPNLFSNAVYDKLLWAVTERIGGDRKLTSDYKMKNYKMYYSHKDIYVSPEMCMSDLIGEDDLDFDQYSYFVSAGPIFYLIRDLQIYESCAVDGGSISYSCGGFKELNDMVNGFLPSCFEDAGVNFDLLPDTVGYENTLVFLKSEKLASFLHYRKAHPEKFSKVNEVIDGLLDIIRGFTVPDHSYGGKPINLTYLQDAESVSGEVLDCTLFVYDWESDVINYSGYFPTMHVGFAFALKLLEDIVLSSDKKYHYCK